MAVAIDIQAGYPQGNITPEGGSLTVVGKVAWSDIIPAITQLFPAPTTAGPGTGAIDPGFGLYRCQSCEFKPVGTDPLVNAGGTPFTSIYDANFTMPFYEFAWLTINYSSLQVEYPSVAGDTPDTPDGSTAVYGLVHNLSSGGETITLSDRSLYWSDEKSANGEKVSARKIIATVEHNVMWKRVASPPWESMRTLIGKVNSTNLGPFQTGTILNETLLYLGFTATPDITAAGDRVWEIGYRFSERRVDELASNYGTGTGAVADGVVGYEDTYGGWNHFWKQEEPVTVDGENTEVSGLRRLHATKPEADYHLYQEGYAIFKKADLTALFVQV
jgi:hypothetical protein